MKIIIEYCSNGASTVFDDGEIQDKIVYKFDESDLSGLQELLYDIKEQFYPGSKHDEFRVHVSLEHGTDYVCKGCNICEVERG
jgi:hypothetical protein